MPGSIGIFTGLAWVSLNFSAKLLRYVSMLIYGKCFVPPIPFNLKA